MLKKNSSAHVFTKPFKIFVMKRLRNGVDESGVKEERWEIVGRSIKRPGDITRLRGAVAAKRLREMGACPITDQLFSVLADQAGMLKRV